MSEPPPPPPHSGSLPGSIQPQMIPAGFHGVAFPGMVAPQMMPQGFVAVPGAGFVPGMPMPSGYPMVQGFPPGMLPVIAPPGLPFAAVPYAVAPQPGPTSIPQQFAQASELPAADVAAKPTVSEGAVPQSLESATKAANDAPESPETSVKAERPESEPATAAARADGGAGSSSGGKRLPQQFLQELANFLVTTDVMNMDEIGAQFLRGRPGSGVGVRALADIIKRIASKEKDSSGKTRWRLRPEAVGLTRGEDVDVNSLEPIAPVPFKAAKRQAAAASSAGDNAAPPAPKQAPMKRAKVEIPSAPKYLSKYSTESAVALCDVIIQVLNSTLRGPDDPYTAGKPPTRIDWARVANAVKDVTDLKTPLECQRLWKYIAHGIDVGELAVLAPDSDDEV